MRVVWKTLAVGAMIGVGGACELLGVSQPDFPGGPGKVDAGSITLPDGGAGSSSSGGMASSSMSGGPSSGGGGSSSGGTASSGQDPAVCTPDVADGPVETPLEDVLEPIGPSGPDIQGCADDGLEPNNGAAEARVLTLEQVSNSQLRSCGGDDWFSFPLPAGTGMQVRITFEHAESDLDLYLYVGQGAERLVSESAGTMDEETVWIPPQAEDTVTFIRVVNFGGAPVSYALQSPLAQRAENDTCDAPARLNSGDSVTGTTVGATNQLAFTGRACTGYRNRSGDLFYAVRVADGETLTASLTSDVDLALYVVSDCASRCCWAGEDRMEAGVEELRWKNLTGSPQEVILGVDSYDARTAGPFTLSVSVAP